MLRVGPLLLKSSGRRKTALSCLDSSNMVTPASYVFPSLGRTAPLAAERFFSSDKIPDNDKGDVAVRRSPARFAADIRRTRSTEEMDDVAWENTDEPGFKRERSHSRWGVADSTRRVRPQRDRGGNQPRHSNGDYNGREGTQYFNRQNLKTGAYFNKNNRGKYAERNQQDQRTGNHSVNNPNASTSKDSQLSATERLTTLMAQLREMAPKETSPSTAAAAASERTGSVEPLIPSLRQQKPEGRTPGNLPLSKPVRPFLFRPPTSQDKPERMGDDYRRTGYQVPQRQRPNQQRNDQNRHNQSNTPRQRTFRDDMEFLEGRQRRTEDMRKANEAQVDETRVVTLPGGRVGLDLTQTSAFFRIKVDEIQNKLRTMGFASEEINGKEFTIDTDTLELLAMEFGIETVRGEEEIVVDSEELLIKQRRADDAVTFPPRPPVVCIMGHVDHGKTTLMDALRRRSMAQKNPTLKTNTSKQKTKKNSASASTDVAGTEAGGITQIISAFQVEVEGQDNKVTFLDTPGHAAFKSMRQSGSHAADVIVLVVAADDGVSEQTIEILDFYKSIVKGSHGGISMVIALNKIDKPGIDVAEAQTRIENQLLEQGIFCEGMKGESEYGPPVQVIPTSGLTGEGLDDLMDGLILQSEVMDLRADQEAHAEGIVMDARMEKGLGVVVDCIVRWGSVKKGDYIVSGTQASRVRMLKDVNDKMLTCGLPSQPVRIVGFKSLPKAGDPIFCVESEEVAEEMVEQRLAMDEEDTVDCRRNASDVEIHINGMKSRDSKRAAKFHELADLQADDGTIRIPIIVKADADGSLSAVRDSLVSLGAKSSHKVIVDPIQEGIGEITPTDIQMAKESNACIFAFGLKRIDPAMMNLAESEGVLIRSNDIIYSLLDDAKKTLGEYLPPQPDETIHGRASIQATFVVTTEGDEEKVAGLKVLEGHLYKEKAPSNVRTHFRVYRKGAQISPNGQAVKASSLRKFKEQVDSVRHGEECGLGLMGFEEFEEGDEIECYSVEMKSATL